MFLSSIYEFYKIFELATLIKINDSVTNSLRKRKRYKSLKEVFELAATLFYIFVLKKTLRSLVDFKANDFTI